MVPNYKKLERCCACGNTELVPVIDLGEQSLTGVFPRSPDQDVTRGPLRLVKCEGSAECGLLQLEHKYDLKELYGANYGYRSGLNSSMVRHLQKKVEQLLRMVPLRSGDLVVDIGSNDGTTLSAYPSGYVLVGVDPTAEKFRSFYRPDVHVIPDFFSAGILEEAFPGRRARIVTSFAMFYDLEQPLQFMAEVREILDDDGLWVFEQSYMPIMLERNAYDTICHEHLEYFGLAQIAGMATRAGFKVVDVEFNDVNGGSFSVTVAKPDSAWKAADKLVAEIIERERAAMLHTRVPYAAFARRIERSREELGLFLENARADGKTVYGLGASTKGNVILQYCGLTSRHIRAIGEVNTEKFGCYTPGTFIPIVPESEVLATRPDYLVVFPWHFRRFFVNDPNFKGIRITNMKMVMR